MTRTGYYATGPTAHPDAVDERFDTTGVDGETVTLDVFPFLPLDSVTLLEVPLEEGGGPGQYSLSGRTLTLHGLHAATVRGLRVVYRSQASQFSRADLDIPEMWLPPPGQSLPPGPDAFVSPWVEAGQGRGVLVSAKAGGPVTVRLDWSNDDVLDPPGTKSVNHTITISGFSGSSSFTSPTEGKHFRVRVDNDGPAPVTLELLVRRLGSVLEPVMFPVGSQIQPTWQALLVKALITGSQPDGAFVDARVDGLAFRTVDPLGGASVFLSSWMGTDGWGTIELFVAADSISAPNGIEIEFTADASVPVPSVRATLRFQFDTLDVARGFKRILLPVLLSAFRVRYTNGSTPHTAFLFAGFLRTEQVPPQDAFDSTIRDTTIAQFFRGALAAKNPSGVYGNIERGPVGGLNVNLAESTGQVDVAALPTWGVNRVVVGTVAVQIAGVALEGRRAIGVTSLASANKNIFWGPSSGLTTGNGDFIPSGVEKAMDLDATAKVWVIADSANEEVTFREVGKT